MPTVADEASLLASFSDAEEEEPEEEEEEEEEELPPEVDTLAAYRKHEEAVSALFATAPIKCPRSCPASNFICQSHALWCMSCSTYIWLGVDYEDAVKPK